MEWLHKSVLLSEVVELLVKNEGGTYADLTFGEGGHSEALLAKEASALWAVDRDLSAVEAYLKEGKAKSDSRLVLQHMKFSQFADCVGTTLFDGILIDLGVSTRQILSQERGFTFQADGPLDMRMDPKGDRSLKEILETLSEQDLADIFFHNADLRESRSLARKVYRLFHEGKIQTTQDLAACFGPKRGKTHPATVPFMALRMAVNQELEEIENTLPQLINLLKPQGRLAVITFHSTEDRLVKRVFKQLAGKCICQDLICLCSKEARVKLLTKKPIEPSQQELKHNPRSRSAKLRCVEKLP